MASNNVKQSKNNLKIIGLLVENSLKSGIYKNKDGIDTNYISGTLTVRVPQNVSGKDEIEEIPVSTWVPETTSTGAANPAYESMKRAMDSYISLAVCDDESKATKVMINSANITENIYSMDGERVFCTPRIQANFINSITNPGNYTPEATFLVDMVVGNIEEEVDKENISTGRLKIKGMICRYNGTMDTIDFFVENKNAIDYIRTYWKLGDTVQVSGKVRFTVKTEQIEVPTAFGDPIVKTKTINCRELIIGSQTEDLPEEQKFTKEEIEKGLKLRNEIIESAKSKAKTKKTTTTTTKSTNPYGF